MARYKARHKTLKTATGEPRIDIFDAFAWQTWSRTGQYILIEVLEDEPQSTTIVAPTTNINPITTGTVKRSCCGKK